MSDHLRIVLWATPRYLAAWPRVSHSGSWPGRRVPEAPRLIIAQEIYPNLQLFNMGKCRVLRRRHRHADGHGLLRGRQLERLERPDERARTPVRLVLECATEP